MPRMNFGKFQKRRGIGTVITTLIVLIASVVLGAGVILFGGSLFQSNTENEAIQVSNSHIWVNSTSSQAGFVVQNSGGKVVSVQSITIRGSSVPTSSWYYNIANATQTNIQNELAFRNQGLITQIPLKSSPPNAAFTQATGPVSLKQGQAAIIYLVNPAGISSIDSGLAFTMNVQAGKSSAVQSVSVVSG